MFCCKKAGGGRECSHQAVCMKLLLGALVPGGRRPGRFHVSRPSCALPLGRWRGHSAAHLFSTPCICRIAFLGSCSGRSHYTQAIVLKAWGLPVGLSQGHGSGGSAVCSGNVPALNFASPGLEEMMLKAAVLHNRPRGARPAPNPGFAGWDLCSLQRAALPAVPRPLSERRRCLTADYLPGDSPRSTIN